ncbi:MAG: hypothetical protein HY652_00275 [Acidobacteria bacterium]|nr:hypothetical protein [Acidobacteriota bacterium]
MKRAGASVGLGLLLLSLSVHGQKFLPDDPVWEDPDRMPIPRPREIELSQIADFLESTFLLRPRDNAPIPRAQNINTLGEVPDSSWFTNRIGLRPMSMEELVRGPNQFEGPDLSRPWLITRAKSEGITPGFTVRDGRGDVYFIKFDPLGNPQMATSTEVIATKFFHAFGYHVPENYLAFIKPENLELASDATVSENGKRRKMTLEDVDLLLDKVPRRSDGTFQALASRALPGKPVGHFKYYGTRSDDPNDIFPHQDRRELRGLRVFAAWLNHDDSRSINSLDTYLTDGGRGYLKHHLLDFGSCLGSASVEPQDPRAGNEYILEWAPMIQSALTLGWWDRPWRSIEYPDYPAVGRFEGDSFHPARWKPEYPNPAFDRMQSDDALWATRMVMRFTDEMIRALVGTGRISDPKAENYLVETLIKRRDKIVRYYLAQTNPLDDFRLIPSSGSFTLEFAPLGVVAGISPVDAYEYQWFRFDNEQLSTEPLGKAASASVPSLPLPKDGARYLMVQIRTLRPDQPSWRKKVEVFIRNGAEKAVVGIERER